MKRSIASGLLAVIGIVACSQTGQLGDPQAGKTTQPKQSQSQAAKQGKAADIKEDGNLAAEDRADVESADTAKEVTPPKKPATKPATSDSTKPTSPASADSNVVKFTIRAGTGRGAWNTRDNPIRARVGQTLEITNGDSTQHWVHTNFSPFPHPFSGIGPGQTVRYRLNSANAGGMRDHSTGGAIFMQISQ